MGDKSKIPKERERWTAIINIIDDMASIISELIEDEAMTTKLKMRNIRNNILELKTLATEQEDHRYQHGMPLSTIAGLPQEEQTSLPENLMISLQLPSIGGMSQEEQMSPTKIEKKKSDAPHLPPNASNAPYAQCSRLQIPKCKMLQNKRNEKWKEKYYDEKQMELSWVQHEKCLSFTYYKKLILENIRVATTNGIDKKDIAFSLHQNLLGSPSLGHRYLTLQSSIDPYNLSSIEKTLVALDPNSHLSPLERLAMVKPSENEDGLSYMQRLVFEYDAICPETPKGARNRIIKKHFLDTIERKGLGICEKDKETLRYCENLSNMAIYADEKLNAAISNPSSDPKNNMDVFHEKKDDSGSKDHPYTQLSLCQNKANDMHQASAIEVMNGKTKAGQKICFRCTSTTHLAPDCKSERFCAFCQSNLHTTKFHAKFTNLAKPILHVASCCFT